VKYPKPVTNYAETQNCNFTEVSSETRLSSGSDVGGKDRVVNVEEASGIWCILTALQLIFPRVHSTVT